MSKTNRSDMKNAAPKAEGTGSCALMLAGMIVMIACAIVALVKLFTGHFLWALIFFLIAVAAFFFVDFVVKLDDRSIKKRKLEYRQKYLTEIKLRDLELGELIFYHDSNLRELSLIHGIPALWGEGEMEIKADDSGMDTAPLVECIKRIRRDRYSIVQGMLETVRDVYDNEGITEDEKEGVPVDGAYIRRHLSVNYVDVALSEDGGWSAVVRGSMSNSFADHIGEHGISAEFTNNSPEYDFYSG